MEKHWFQFWKNHASTINLFPVLPEQNTSNGVHYRSGYDAQLFFGDVSNYKNRDPDLR